MIKRAYMMLTLCFLLFTCFSVNGCQRESEITSLSYGELPNVTFVNDLPVWKGIIPGKTTRKEAIEILGTPEMIWSSNGLEAIRYLPNGYERKANDLGLYYRLVLSQDIVQIIDIEVWGCRYGDLLTNLDPPDQFINYAEQDDVALFARRGIAAVVTEWNPRDDAAITLLRYFVPTSTANYLEKWGNFHPQYLPWQRSILDRVYELDILPGVTSEKSIENLFGIPDFEWNSGSFKEIAYLLPDAPSYVIHRFRFSKGILTWMNAVLLQEESYTIGRAIEHIGLPEAVVCHQQSHLKLPLQQYIWPDQGIVLISRALEVQSNEIMISSIGDCARPSSDDVVRGYVRIKPLTLKEFLARKLDIQVMEEVNSLDYY